MKHKTTPTTGLLLDVAASRFRQGLARLITVEAGTQADSPASIEYGGRLQALSRGLYRPLLKDGGRLVAVVWA